MASVDPALEPRFRFGLPAVTLIVLVLAALRLYIAGHSGLAFDEGYYTFWSERLATGYLDHPPAVAVLIAARPGGCWAITNSACGYWRL